MKTLMTQLDEDRGAVRIEDTFDTDAADLWDACTDPARLARWIAHVSGDLRVGGVVQAVFTSTWSGPMRVDACEAPHHLLLTGDPGTAEETQIEAWLTPEDGRTRLVVENRGMSLASLHFHAAGWQAHLEDLRRVIGGAETAHPGGWSESRASAAWHARWSELTPTFAPMSVS